MLRTGILLAASISTLLLGGCSGEAGAEAGTGGGSERTRLAMIPKGTTHVFWNTVREGADRAAAELDVELIWKGPLEENDRAQQIQVVQQFVSQGVDGILLAPLDHRALVSPVRQSLERGIPVLVFDSALAGEPGTDYLSFVATDSLAGGRIAGEHLAELLDADGTTDGKAVLLRYLVGSASTDQRESGFLEAAQERGLEVLVDNRYAGASTGEAKTAALNMIESVRAAGGVFTPCEPVTMGMLLALRQENLIGSVKFVGFDASPPLVAALDAGEIDALVVQDPRKMGYLAVQTMVAHLAGEPVDAMVDTGVVLVTRENRNDPEIAKLLE